MVGFVATIILRLGRTKERIQRVTVLTYISGIFLKIPLQVFLERYAYNALSDPGRIFQISRRLESKVLPCLLLPSLPEIYVSARLRHPPAL